MDDLQDVGEADGDGYKKGGKYLMSKSAPVHCSLAAMKIL